MTRAELEQKWPRAQFANLKARGLAHPDETYEEYLQMRAEQETLAQQQKLELFGHDGVVPYEEPPELPELDEAELAALEHAWARAAEEQVRLPEEVAA